jgi:hypothetical protein
MFWAYKYITRERHNHHAKRAILPWTRQNAPLGRTNLKQVLYLLSIHSTLPLVQMSRIKVEMKAKIAPNTFMV